ncbi:hypothetical protein NNC19_18685 [Clostridium sp. SHJSY1]|uniref:hypothetical protein n=1 Tax=Clostridium sp. SHJSY1 TaxID=2942483 RepID=UPI0028765CCC|nr:hypothetical protein [Clostridium sp. SHJSY1]MDS0527720.1 hypothetical protein [Clostridium sp. SHJSY1]
MSIERIVKDELNLENDFDYQKLYNDNRGAIHKDDYKALLKYCIEEKIIDVKKYLIEENIKADVLHDIVDRSGEGQHRLKEALKEYHQESYYLIAPFIYLLEMIEPKYKLNEDRNKYKDSVLEFPKNILVGHKFEKSNAFIKLYFKDRKIAINSSNDNIDNLIDTLEIDELTVYVLDIEKILNREQNIVIYKLTKKGNFNELKEKAEHRFLEELSKYKLR